MSLPAPPKPGVLSALGDGRFRALLASQGLTDLGGMTRVAAQSWIVFDLTGSQLWVGLIAGLRAVPIILLSALGGALADRYSRRLVLVWNRLVLAGLAVATAVLLWSGQAEAWHFIILALASGSAFALGGPAFWALLPDVVPPNRLANSNGLVAAVHNTGEMVGPAAVGFLIAVSGEASVFLALTGAYALALMFLLWVGEPPRVRGELALSVMEDVKVGLSYARRTQPLPWLIVLVMAQNLLGTAIFPLIPVYAADVLDSGAGGFGTLAGSLGAGLFVGAVGVALWGNYRRRALVMLVSGLVWDVGMVWFGYSRSFPLSMGILFVIGLSGAYWVNAVLLLFQEVSASHVRGRVMSLYVLSMEMFPLGWLYGGAVAAWLGNEEALIISALGGTPVMVLALVLNRELRRL